MIAAGLIIAAVAVNTVGINAPEPVNSVRNNPSKQNASISNRVKVAILDSGSNIACKEGISFIDGTLKDYNGHGTLMAGIIKEVNPETELYIIKVMGKDGLAVNEEVIIRGLEWAISRKVDVINMSLKLKRSERLHKVIKKAYDKGIVIVAAAGNREPLLGPSSEPSAHLSVDLSADMSPGVVAKKEALAAMRARLSLARRRATEEVAYPARYREVIAVGALDRDGRVDDDSIMGREVDIFCRGYKGGKAGTSVASAYAAGLAAKIISENPDSSIREIKNIMRAKTERE